MAAQMIWLWLLLPCHVYPTRVAIVELNHVVDPVTGNVTFEQLIWWDWCGDCQRTEVRDWRNLTDVGQPRQTDQGWLSEWRDGWQRWRIMARWRIETWTPYDVEIEDRRYLATERRRNFRRR